MNIPQWAFLSMDTMNHVDQHDEGVIVVVALGSSNDDNKYLELVEWVKVVFCIAGQWNIESV